jgi:hypothetical protein
MRTSQTPSRRIVSARVINIKSGEPYDVYIGDRMPPFMSPTGEYLPQSIWRNPFNKATRLFAEAR